MKRNFPNDDGKTVVLATDRPLGGPESMSGSTSMNYPISVIVLDLDKEGNGSGTLNIAVQVLWDKYLKVLNKRVCQLVVV